MRPTLDVVAPKRSETCTDDRPGGMVEPKMTAADDGATGLGRVAAIVEAPEAVLPWLDRFYDEDDAALLAALKAVKAA